MSICISTHQHINISNHNTKKNLDTVNTSSTHHQHIINTSSSFTLFTHFSDVMWCLSKIRTGVLAHHSHHSHHASPTITNVLSSHRCLLLGISLFRWFVLQRGDWEEGRGREGRVLGVTSSLTCIDYGEEDLHLRRGKPLKLSRSRMDQLRSVFSILSMFTGPQIHCLLPPSVTL